MKINNKHILMGIGIVFSIFFLILFEFTGLRLILGFMLVFILPIYLILGLFKLDPLEKGIYSFFLGAGIIPTLVYYMGIIISFRAAIVIVFIALLVVGYLLRKRLKSFAKP